MASRCSAMAYGRRRPPSPKLSGGYGSSGGPATDVGIEAYLRSGGALRRSGERAAIPILVITLVNL